MNILRNRGIIPGIKVDKGVIPLAGTIGEATTQVSDRTRLWEGGGGIFHPNFDMSLQYNYKWEDYCSGMNGVAELTFFSKKYLIFCVMC